MKTLQIEVTNRRNLTLRGIATMPDGNGPFPTVLNLHGFGGTKEGPKCLHVTTARALAAYGIACIRFDFSCNGESDGEFEDMTFTSLLEDTEDIWNWAKTQPYTDARRMILSGHSMGGFVAASSAPKLNPAGLILMCPGKQMWDGCGDRSRAMEAQGITYGDIEGLKFSHAFNYDLETYRPFEDAAGYPGPVLLVRGTKDELVNDTTCESYLALYENKASRFVHIENGNHNFSGIPCRTKLTETLCQFAKEVALLPDSHENQADNHESCTRKKGLS